MEIKYSNENLVSLQNFCLAHLCTGNIYAINYVESPKKIELLYLNHYFFTHEYC